MPDPYESPGRIVLVASMLMFALVVGSWILQSLGVPHVGSPNGCLFARCQ